MNEQRNKEQFPGNDSLKLFVYGTLRRGGLASHYLEDYPLLLAGLRLSGYVLYDAGWYPYALEAGKTSTIIGDVFEVPRLQLPVLDRYEGQEYKRHFLEKEEMLIYLKADTNIQGLPMVPGGDWLSYYKERG